MLLHVVTCSMLLHVVKMLLHVISLHAVINKASLISGGIAVSKVRLMDEDDEVKSHQS